MGPRAALHAGDTHALRIALCSMSPSDSRRRFSRALDRLASVR
jgi:hypothetical protein